MSWLFLYCWPQAKTLDLAAEPTRQGWGVVGGGPFLALEALLTVITLPNPKSKPVACKAHFGNSRTANVKRKLDTACHVIPGRTLKCSLGREAEPGAPGSSHA